MELNELMLENNELKKELEHYKELLQKEEIDEITGLYSKNAFFSKAKQALVENHEKQFLFARINIDKFQLVNSFFGFKEGDRLLKYFAFRLKQLALIVPQSIIGHLGADSFVMCCCDLPNKGLLPLLKKSIHSIISGFRDDFKLSISVGIYFIEDNYMDVSLINSRAIVALKKSKEQYGEYYTIYNESMDEESYKDFFVINDLQTAFNEKQFEVFLQPKCKLSNGKVIGAEALVRWIHPEKGMVSPDNFIPILETNGFITKLDEYVWSVACSFIRSWIDAGLEPIPISVNVSRVDLHNPELVKTLTDLIEKNGIDISYLNLEITESAYSDNPYQIIDTVNKLHDMGFSIELDDFGTGYSSLNVLNAMKLDTLKLDMSFIKAHTEDKKSGDVINFIVRLAKQLKLTVVAEGIETSEQLSFLRGIGCEMGQGFYFSRALSKSDFDEYMRNHSRDTRTVLPIDHRMLLDIDDIWFPNSKFNFIFNHFVGALALFEIKEGIVTLLRTNDEYFKVLNYQHEDVSQFRDDATLSIHKEDIPIVNKLVSAQVNTLGNTGTVVVRAKSFRKENSYIWIKMHGKVVATEKDSIIVLTSLENIDAEYKASEKLKKAAMRQKELENQLAIYKHVGGDGIFSARIQNGIKLEYANEEFCKIHGMTKTYIMKHKDTILEDLIIPEQKDIAYNYIKACIENHETRVKVTLRTKTKSGSVIVLYLRANILYDKKYPVVDAVIQDVSHNN